ncbi:phage tail sheath family protein [Tahibacter soli]|uniref:Phage tail sheath subtilisin-like domain-containing protein n=1 Tax=Tahibacter soli TaxID=2983605 RepID=A0A9X3YTF6_9GAMM|nr:phage tail sheath C-terminal domain-containing protein [Tahibacter soli]MDC8016066.1 phage tail sheath subtilisin-like domain-containing protein [Tahibacter soli]
MPVALTYPGVYVEEIPSGVRTITGVATSIAAFVGWATKGPTDDAGLVLSWSDYVRKYGELDPRSYLGYAVSQFFANGGQRAYIVRLAKGALASKVELKSDAAALALTVSARSPGSWGDDYAVTVKAVDPDNGTKRFRLVVSNWKLGVVVETFENVAMSPTHARFVDNVLKAESLFVTSVATGADLPANTPKGEVHKLGGGSNGDELKPDTADFETAALASTGVLDRVDLFNLLCVPGATTPGTIKSLQAYCRKRRAFMIADCVSTATSDSLKNGPDGNLTGTDSINAAFYFPWLYAPDPAQENRPRLFPPSGFMAGIYARTDTQRGVWKAPAGSEASLTGAIDTKERATDDQNGVLNPLAINCIRNFPVYGIVAWGARTLQGNDERGSEWKYIPVRRTALFIEETLYRATKWVVFEPNDEPLWAQIRLNIGAFMHDLFRQGAFQGASPKDAYFVKCDKETTTQSDINRGIVNIVVGFAPLKPAEFVVIKLQQIAGDIQT